MTKVSIDNGIDIGLAALLWIGSAIIDNMSVITDVTTDALKFSTTVVVFATAIHRWRKARKAKNETKDEV